MLWTGSRRSRSCSPKDLVCPAAGENAAAHPIAVSASALLVSLQEHVCCCGASPVVMQPQAFTTLNNTALVKDITALVEAAGDETLRFWSLFPGPRARADGDAALGGMARAHIR